MNRTAAVGGLLGGIVVGFAAHESGHIVFDVIFDADPGVKRVEYHGIPFFAITHRSNLPPRQEYTISAAGFWVQQGTNEWLLTNPGADVTIDLATTTLSMPNGKSYRFPLEPFAKYCLMNGVDELGFLLSKNDEISTYECKRVAA